MNPENRWVVARGWREGEWGVTANRHRASSWGDENVLELVSSYGGYKFVSIIKSH